MGNHGIYWNRALLERHIGLPPDAYDPEIRRFWEHAPHVLRDPAQREARGGTGRKWRRIVERALSSPVQHRKAIELGAAGEPIPLGTPSVKRLVYEVFWGQLDRGDRGTSGRGQPGPSEVPTDFDRAFTGSWEDIYDLVITPPDAHTSAQAAEERPTGARDAGRPAAAAPPPSAEKYFRRMMALIEERAPRELRLASSRVAPGQNDRVEEYYNFVHEYIRAHPEVEVRRMLAVDTADRLVHLRQRIAPLVGLPRASVRVLDYPTNLRTDGVRWLPPVAQVLGDVVVVLDPRSPSRPYEVIPEERLVRFYRNAFDATWEGTLHPPGGDPHNELLTNGKYHADRYAALVFARVATYAQGLVDHPSRRDGRGSGAPTAGALAKGLARLVDRLEADWFAAGDPGSVAGPFGLVHLASDRSGPRVSLAFWSASAGPGTRTDITDLGGVGGHVIVLRGEAEVERWRCWLGREGAPDADEDAAPPWPAERGDPRQPQEFHLEPILSPGGGGEILTAVDGARLLEQVSTVYNSTEVVRITARSRGLVTLHILGPRPQALRVFRPAHGPRADSFLLRPSATARESLDWRDVQPASRIPWRWKA